MRRAFTVLAAVLASAAGGSTAVITPTATARASSGHTEVELHHAGLGEILADASGYTLYEFTRDRADENSCVSIAGCRLAWPALQTSGKPTAVRGVKVSLLSTIKLPDGTDQVTYGGHPLYLYFSDHAPGDTAYVGQKSFGGYWYAINASGHAVK